VCVISLRATAFRYILCINYADTCEGNYAYTVASGGRNDWD
jgi:hypothetical protein